VYVITCTPAVETILRVPLPGNPVVETTLIVPCGSVAPFEPDVIVVLAKVTPLDPAAIVVLLVKTIGANPITPVPPVHPVKVVAVVPVYVTSCLPVLVKTKILPLVGKLAVDGTVRVAWGNVVALLATPFPVLIVPVPPVQPVKVVAVLAV
jgi:hypothetical protein